MDRDNESGFPIINALVLGFIALVLYLIWDKLNEKITPSRKGFGASPMFSSSGPGYNGKGKDY